MATDHKNYCCKSQIGLGVSIFCLILLFFPTIYLSFKSQAIKEENIKFADKRKQLKNSIKELRKKVCAEVSPGLAILFC